MSRRPDHSIWPRGDDSRFPSQVHQIEAGVKGASIGQQITTKVVSRDPNLIPASWTALAVRERTAGGLGEQVEEVATWMRSGVPRG
jgi:hypothetical protein